MHNQLPFLTLNVDGGNLDVFKYVTIIPSAEPFPLTSFDVVKLINSASLQMDFHSDDDDSSKTSLLDIKKFIGDKTGLIHGHAGHKVVIEVDENKPMAAVTTDSSNRTTENFARTPVNIIMDKDSELIIPIRFKVRTLLPFFLWFENLNS